MCSTNAGARLELQGPPSISAVRRPLEPSRARPLVLQSVRSQGIFWIPRRVTLEPKQSFISTPLSLRIEPRFAWNGIGLGLSPVCLSFDHAIAVSASVRRKDRAPGNWLLLPFPSRVVPRLTRPFFVRSQKFCGAAGSKFAPCPVTARGESELEVRSGVSSGTLQLCLRPIGSDNHLLTPSFFPAPNPFGSTSTKNSPCVYHYESS